MISLLRPIALRSLNRCHALIMTSVGILLRIVQSQAFLPLEPAINRVLAEGFPKEMGSVGCKGVPAIWMCRNGEPRFANAMCSEAAHSPITPPLVQEEVRLIRAP